MKTRETLALKLWDWARAAYDAQSAQQMLLALQDDHGQSVCLLLWAAWRAKTGESPDADALAQAAALARRWEREAVAPLRAVRRALKPTWPGLAEAEREALREHVKACELEAEQRLLEALGAAWPPARQPGRRPAGMASALAAAAAAWGGTTMASTTLAALARIFEGLDF
ncbi:MAG: TIGR02444 family protein [Caulobacteraceae bacterium]|nr:TIGR02444 family protein [Caulobacteraceae bacterium]